MKKTLKIFLIVIAVFAFMYVSLRPELQYIRDSVYYTVFIILFIDGVVLYVMFSRSLQTSLPTKIVLSSFLIYPLLRYTELTVREKDLLLYAVGFMIILTTVLVYLYKLKRNTKKQVFEKYPMITGILIVIRAVAVILDIQSIDKLSFIWILSGIISLVLTSVSILIVIRYKKKITDRQNIYAIPLLVLMISFIFPALSGMFLNYALDDSEPLIYQAEVIDKEIHQGGRSITTYNLFVKIEGKETSLGTSQSEYYDLIIGDIIEVKKYEGAFNLSYLLYEP